LANRSFHEAKETKNRKCLRNIENSMKEGLTYYDASYIQAAVDNGLTLVTDDEQLYKTDRKYVKTITSNEL